jgi:hypothetical protein
VGMEAHRLGEVGATRPDKGAKRDGTRGWYLTREACDRFHREKVGLDSRPTVEVPLYERRGNWGPYSKRGKEQADGTR